MLHCLKLNKAAKRITFRIQGEG